MSDSLEYRLDLALDHAARANTFPKTDSGTHGTDWTNPERQQTQTRFWTDVRSFIQQAATRANRHLASRHECCEFYDISACFTGPLHVGEAVCNPIAYQFRVDGRQVGETLLVELTPDGLVQASLGLPRPPYPEAPTDHIDFGWHPVPLPLFTAEDATDLLIRYTSYLTARWPLRRAFPTGAMAIDEFGRC